MSIPMLCLVSPRRLWQRFIGFALADGKVVFKLIMVIPMQELVLLVLGQRSLA